ncbi:hypothetical protein Tco_0439320 [Tanacetum coccineum]
MTPRSCLRWKPTGRVFKNVVLRWVPTGKTFASSTTKVDSEPPNGSNADITNQCESEQALDVSAGTLLSTVKFKAGSKSCSLSKQDSYITTRVGITIPPSYSNAEDNRNISTRDTNVFTMMMEILLEPASNKLLVNAKSMSMLVKDSRSQDGIDDKDNDEGSKSRSQSMKEQAYNKEQRERPRPHELNDKNNLIDLMKECHQ